MLAWVSAVLFAFVTNRRWVFQSKAGTAREVFSELIVFVMCRLATGVVDIVCMYVFVQQLYFDDMIIKIGANILVIVLNYFASKFLIFKKEK